MADPVPNADIEDVLSSIRRLVADRDWAREEARKAEAEGLAHAVDPDPAGKFVLTPSLRVVELEPVKIAEGQVAPLDTPEVDVVADVVAAEEIVEPVQAVVDAPQGGDSADAHLSEEMAQDPLPTDWQSDLAGSNAPDSDAPDSVSQVSEPDLAWEDIEETAWRPEPMSRLASLEATIAELEAAVTGQPDEWEPDGTEEMTDIGAAPFVHRTPDPLPRDPARDAALRDISRDAALRDISRDAALRDVSVIRPDPMGGGQAAEAQALQDDAADLPSDLSGEPDDDIAAELAEDLAGDGADDLADYLDDYGMIDEAMLRDLVVEIVRQELQGALGERITRNVRKLVRREIYRVLASQDFE